MSDKKKAPKAEAPTKQPHRRGPHNTTPEQRKRGRWLAGLFATRQPQHPRVELVKGPNGQWVSRELTQKSRATRAEFMGKRRAPEAVIEQALAEAATDKP